MPADVQEQRLCECGEAEPLHRAQRGQGDGIQGEAEGRDAHGASAGGDREGTNGSDGAVVVLAHQNEPTRLAPHITECSTPTHRLAVDGSGTPPRTCSANTEMSP